MRFLCTEVISCKIDTALYNNKKQHQLEGYFIVDTILGLSHPGTLAGS
jgi:hypothetical protein